MTLIYGKDLDIQVKHLTRNFNYTDIRPVKNRPGINKPVGGVWTSPYLPDNEFVSPWHEWCVSEDFCVPEPDSFVVFLKPRSKTRIHKIDSLSDLIEITMNFPNTVKRLKLEDIPDSELTDTPLVFKQLVLEMKNFSIELNKKFNLHTTEFFPDVEHQINFELISNYYDALYLTEEGQWATRYTTPNLYGWDVRSCLFLKPEFDVINQYQLKDIIGKNVLEFDDFQKKISMLDRNYNNV